jgi:hypothetical protein
VLPRRLARDETRHQESRLARTLAFERDSGEHSLAREDCPAPTATTSQ